MINWLIALLALFSVSAQAEQTERDSPALMVLIGVDQFRADYLLRYNAAFTGGFRRMLDSGTWYRKATVDHAPTLTLPGHTTLATGANPRTHGITSNAWVSPGQETTADGRLSAVTPSLDLSRRTLGDERDYAWSSEHILVESLADWVRKADAESRSVAVSVTGLAALYGGRPAADRTKNHVYWLGSTGKFLASDYYRDDYPDWVNEFNDAMADRYVARQVWQNTVPTAYRQLARADDVAYEHDGVHTHFPHRAEDSATGEMDQTHYERWFGRYSPYQNDALFDFAKTAVGKLELGQRGAVDLLCLAIKLTDRIGHDFGPNSLEQLDVILRLDRLLGDFFTFLDKTVGAGHYVIALSADHGAPNVSEYEREQGRQALRIESEAIAAALDSVARLVKEHTASRGELPALIAARLEEFPFVEQAMTAEELLGTGTADPITMAYRNSYRPERPPTYPLWTHENRYGNLVGPEHPVNFGVVVELVKNANIWAAPSTHGSSHSYDREVPILFMGSGIQARVTDEKVHTRDVAPTLAKLAGIAYPATVDGRPLELH
jgi:predicted AlkP superfamily pyrophosphatase or phosphodiesterase